MKTFLISFIFLLSQFSMAARTPFFSCEQDVEGYRVFLLVMEKQGSYISKMDWGRGKQEDPAKFQPLSKQEALDNSFVADLADRVLRLDWKKVSTVEFFEVGDYSDDAAGALGINFLDSHNAVLYKGMWMGWGGPMSCLKTSRSPR